jgi:hypothetical protein
MPGELAYVPSETTALITPDALAIMLRQGGLKCAIEKRADGDADIVLAEDETTLLLAVEDGFVSSVVVDVTFVDERAKAPRVCEMLESLGWVRDD